MGEGCMVWLLINRPGGPTLGWHDNGDRTKITFSWQESPLQFQRGRPLTFPKIVAARRRREQLSQTHGATVTTVPNSRACAD